jgi:TolA-binding protein
MRKPLSVVVSAVLALVIAVGLTSAQEQKKGTESKSAEKEKVKGKLPNYFAQIGLSRKQEDDVRKAAQPYDERIAELRKQIDEMDKQVDEQEAAKLAACEKLLTEGQKTALAERRTAAEAEKAKKKSAKKTANGGEKKSDEKKTE